LPPFVHAVQQGRPQAHVLSDPLQQFVIVDAPAQPRTDFPRDRSALRAGLASEGDRAGGRARLSGGPVLPPCCPVVVKVLQGARQVSRRGIAFHLRAPLFWRADVAQTGPAIWSRGLGRDTIRLPPPSSVQPACRPPSRGTVRLRGRCLPHLVDG